MLCQKRLLPIKMMSTPAQSPPRLSPLLVLLVGIVATSISSILIRLAQAEAPSLVVAAWRMILATAMLLPLCWQWRRPELARLDSGGWALATAAGLFLALHFASWISSLAYTSVASSTVLVTTTPIWVGLASPIFLKESLSRLLKVGIVLAVGGSMIIGLGATGIGSNPLLGNSLALVGAVSGSAYFLIGRRLRLRLSLLSYATVVYGVAAVVLWLVVLWQGLPMTGYSPITYLLLFLMALVPQLLGHSSYNWALGYLPAAYVSVAIVSEPVVASFLALLIFQEIPGWLTLVGGALILGGIVVSSKR
jgi:drug/metabolite transporter (DMT)-like permease